MLLSSESILTLVNVLTGYTGIIDPQTKKAVDEIFHKLSIEDFVESYEKLFQQA